MEDGKIDYTNVTRISEYLESDLLEEDIKQLSDGGMLRENYHFNLNTGRLTNVNIPGSNIMVLNYTDNPEYLDMELFREKCEESLSEYMSNLYILNDEVAVNSLVSGLIDFTNVEIEHLIEMIKDFDQTSLSKKDLDEYLTNISKVDGIENVYHPSKITSLFPMYPISFYEKPENLKMIRNNINVYSKINNLTVSQILDDVDCLLKNKEFIDGVDDADLVNHRSDINNYLREKLAE